MLKFEKKIRRQKVNRKDQLFIPSVSPNRPAGAVYYRFLFNDLPVLLDDKPLCQRQQQRHTDFGAAALLLRMSTPKPEIRRRVQCTWSSS